MIKKEKKYLDIFFVLILLAWLLLSFLFIKRVYILELEKRADKILQKSQTLELALFGESLKKLNALPEDVDSVYYHSLKKRLSDIKKNDHEIAFAYIIKKENGNIFFMVDSEPVGSINYSPPGQIFFEADEQVYNSFNSRKPILTSPTTDRWGTWISALVPMELENGEIFAVFGIDYPANSWNEGAIIAVYYAGIISFFVLLLLIFIYHTIKKDRDLKVINFKYRNITDNVLDVIWITDLNLKFSYVSSSSEKIIGWKAKDFLESSPEDRVPPQEAKKISDAVKSFLEREEKGINVDDFIVLEVEHYRRDKSIFWAELRFKFIRNSKGKIIGIQGLTRDISDRKKFEDELSKIMKSVDQSPVSIVITDIKGAIEYVNPKFIEVTGYSFEEAIGQNPRILKSGEKSSDEYKDLWVTITSGNTWIGEFHNKTKEGKLYWERASISPVTDSSGKIINFVAVKEDITARKLAEDKLKESEERYLSLFNKMINAFALHEIILDKKGVPVDYKFVEVNKSFLKMTKTKKEQVIGKKAKDIFPGMKDDSIDWVSVYGKVALTGKGSRFVSYSSVFDKWYSVYVYSPKKGFFATIFEDITREKKSFDLIKVSEKRYEDLARQSRTFVWQIDSKAKYTYLSENVEDILGYKKEDMIGRSIFDFHPKKGLADFKKNILGNIKKGLNFQKIESPITTKKGYIIWVSNSGVPSMDSAGKFLSCQGSSIDITNRVRQQERIEKNLLDIIIEKEKVETIVQGIGDGVFVVNNELEIILFNKKISEMSGLKQKDVLGKKYNEVLKFINEDDGKTVDSFIKKAFSTGKIQKMDKNTLLVRGDGSFFPVEDSSAPLKDKSGNIIGCVVVMRDATKERKLDKVKSEFISVASHQLKTPLTNVKWMTELLLDNSFGDISKEQKEFVESIYFNNKRMIKLVNDLLDVSRIEEGKKFNIKKKKSDVVKIVSRVLGDVSWLLKERDIKITKCSGAPKELFLKIDESKIEQVFSNLITNAIKYSKPKSRVNIACEHNDDFIIFKIKDSGIGIPKDQQVKVFDKFFRASNAVSSEADGTGLGLHIVKAIVESHGGKIWFKSTEGKGTIFFFSLPIK